MEMYKEILDKDKPRGNFLRRKYWVLGVLWSSKKEVRAGDHGRKRAQRVWKGKAFI